MAAQTQCTPWCTGTSSRSRSRTLLLSCPVRCSGLVRVQREAGW